MPHLPARSRGRPGSPPLSGPIGRGWRTHRGPGRDPKGPAMTQDRLHLTFAGLDYLDRTRALVDGSWRSRTSSSSTADGPYELFQRVAQGVEFDVAEMSASTYMSLVSQGDDRYVGLPIFLSRHFRHGYIFVHGASDIRGPADLVGRRVGVPDYEMTAALWQRAILMHDFGVRPDQIEWLQGGEFAARVRRAPEDPASQRASRSGTIPEDRTLHDMVATGEIDAVLCPHRPAGLCGRVGPRAAAVPRLRRGRAGVLPADRLLPDHAPDPRPARPLRGAPRGRRRARRGVHARPSALGWQRLQRARVARGDAPLADRGTWRRSPR